MTVRYSGHGIKYGLYLFDSTDLCNVLRITRPGLSADKIKSFRFMARWNPARLATLRTSAGGGESYHNVLWIKRKDI